MKLLVPVDGSTASHNAVGHALWLLQDRPHASVVLLNVQNRDTLGGSEIDAGREAEVAAHQSARVLHAAERACREAGVACESRAEFGPICETILRVAQETHADQIVMGSRGLGRVRAALLGSVVTGVIHAARVPVTVVKKATRLPSGGTASDRA